MNVLFVTWDGPQVSYLESLFLPIFKGLQSYGYNFHVLQFTWGDKQIHKKRQKACEEAGCSYQMVSVFRKPASIGAMLTSLAGAFYIRSAIHNYNIDIVMPRSTLPALGTLLALRKRPEKVVFDADGLPLDERIDFAGRTPSGFLHRFLRDIEAESVRNADVVLTRSKKAVSILHARAGAGTTESKFHVVSNGRDAALFHPGSFDSRLALRNNLGVASGGALIVYAGSLGAQYGVPAMLSLFKEIKNLNKGAHFLVLTGNPEVMEAATANLPDIKDDVTIKSVPSDEVPCYLAAADLGLAFRDPTFSMQGVAPIKLGEYLLCGVPVVATKGVGDAHYIDENSGYLVNHDDAQLNEKVADWFAGKVLPEREVFRMRCRLIGERYFSLSSSVNDYLNALSALSS